MSDLVAGRAEGAVDDFRPGERLSYRLSPLGVAGERVFTARVEFVLQTTRTGTAMDVDYRISDSLVDGADFIAGIELGFGQSLDTLTAILAAASDNSKHDARSTS